MPINEEWITGRKYRVMAESSTRKWNVFSFLTKAVDVLFDDSKTAQQKLGDIDGITADLASGSARLALAASAGKSLSDKIAAANSNIASLEKKLAGIKIEVKDGKLHFTDSTGADTALNFSSGGKLTKITCGPYWHRRVSGQGGIGRDVMTFSWDINIIEEVPSWNKLTVANFGVGLQDLTWYAAEAYDTMYPMIEPWLRIDVISYNNANGTVRIQVQAKELMNEPRGGWDLGVTFDVFVSA